MGKTEKLRKYRKAWETETWAKGWLTQADASANALGEAYCKVCRSYLRAHVTDLKRHTKTKTHSDIIKLNLPLSKQSVLSNIVILTNEQKTIDLKLAVYIATHSSILSVDHLGEILNLIGKNTPLSNLKLHRTKCTSLIKYVLAPSLLEDLIKDVGTSSFSLIVDESTDVSVFKYLCICIKYFSLKGDSVNIQFLGIIEVVSCIGESLYKYICDYMQDIGLDLKNIIGIGTDGANNLCGKYNSLFSRLKQISPTLQIVRCICHSLNNAVSKASEQFPSAIDYLCREIYNWFHISPKRRDEYKKIFDLLNSGSGTKKFHKFHQLSGTRWLARSFVVNSILEHWLELKTHFSLIIKKEKCYASRIIHEMLQDDTNYLYLIIIKPILHELNCLNLTFQKNFIDLGNSYDDICGLFIFLAAKVIKGAVISKGFEFIYDNIHNDSVYLIPNNCDYGIGYNQKILNMNISLEKKTNVQVTAFKFIKELLYEIKLRLPDNIAFFKKLKLFSPTLCLSQLHTKFIDLPFIEIFIDPSHLPLIETQWDKLVTVTWKMYLDESQLSDSLTFWPKVYSFKDAGGNYAFKELAEFVLKILTLPSSNAVVERVFSIMNTVKTKSRNRIDPQMLDALLRIKCTLISTKNCCKTFTPSESMYKKFNSEIMYKYNKVEINVPTNDKSLENDDTSINDELIDIVNQINLPDFY